MQFAVLFELLEAELCYAKLNSNNFRGLLQPDLTAFGFRKSSIMDTAIVQVSFFCSFLFFFLLLFGIIKKRITK